MQTDQWRASIERAHLSHFPEIKAGLWKAWAAGAVSDEDAQSLSELIEAREKLPPAPPAPRRFVGSRPKSAASVERRRGLAASGMMPAAMARPFTVGEQAALAVVGHEVQSKRACELPLEAIAAKAGVSRATVKRAMRHAQERGLIAVEHRKIRAFRHSSNRVTVISQEWLTWLRVGGRSQGVQFRTTTKRQLERDLERKLVGLGDQVVSHAGSDLCRLRSSPRGSPPLVA